jgi:hypothetical protein
VTAVGALVLSQVIAVVSGLASGAIEPTGLPWLAVICLLFTYDISVIGLGISGVLLLTNLFSKTVSG